MRLYSGEVGGSTLAGDGKWHISNRSRYPIWESGNLFYGFTSEFGNVFEGLLAVGCIIWFPFWLNYHLGVYHHAKIL